MSFFGQSASTSPWLNMMRCSVLAYEVAVGGQFGRETEKQVPLSSGCTLLRIRMEPPGRSAIPRATHRPSPVPFPLGGEERLEYATSVVGRDSASAVGEGDANPVDGSGAFLQSAAWLIRSTRSPADWHSVHCVDQQGGEYLSYLAGIARIDAPSARCALSP